VPPAVVYVRYLPPQLVEQYLLPSERIVRAVRMHPIVILDAALWILAGALGAGFVTGVVGSGSPGFVGLVWALWVAWAAWQGWKIATWWRKYFVVTENRLMLITSLVNTDVGMMPLSKVTDMRFFQTSLGHVLGYAHFIVESAGQEQALSRVEYVPYPRQMYRQILSLLFEKQPLGGWPSGGGPSGGGPPDGGPLGGGPPDEYPPEPDEEILEEVTGPVWPPGRPSWPWTPPWAPRKEPAEPPGHSPEDL
jgi:hypothetical protein